jgi:VWFA-related protein
MTSLLSPATLGIVLLLAPGGSAVAAAANAGKPEPPVFGSDVSLVALPVFVVDKQGHAMRGLAPEDFQLLDDGKPVRIVSFQYVDTTSAEAEAEIREAPAARRHFLLLFDLSFTDPGGLHRARSAARAMVLHRLTATDLAGVATFDVNRGIRIVANFTEDRGLLLHAIDTLGVTSEVRINDPLALAASLNAMEQSERAATGRGDDTGTAREVFIDAVARRLRAAEGNNYRAQVGSLVESFSELGRSLRGVAGRKQVLYFSAGFDSQALVGETSTADMGTSAEAVLHGRIFDVDTDARYGDSRLRDVLSTMARALSNADCVVHSVDVTGLGTDRSLTQTSVAKDLGQDSARGHESLNFMAAETGGRFFKGANDLGAAMDEILAMTSRYYILGYQPEDLGGPGRFHKLKVRVLRKGGRVSHRAGYYERESLRGEPVLQRKFEAAQLVMTGLGPNQIHFSALCLPFPAEGERQTLGLVLQVPREELRWQNPLALEVYGYAVGADGTVLDHLAQFARLDPAASDAPGEVRGVSFYGTLQVPPGKYTLKLMVQEPETGAAGVQFIDVTVPPADKRVGFLLPPVLVDEPGQWLVLNMGAGKEGRPELPFKLGGAGFLPRSSFSVQSGTAERLVLIAYEPSRAQDPAAGIEIQSTLTDSEGLLHAPGPMRIERIHRDGGGRRTYVLGYTPEGLPPGDYTLRIGIGEAGAQLESYSLLRVAKAAPSRN